MNRRPFTYYANALPTELLRHLILSWTIISILFYFNEEGENLVTRLTQNALKIYIRFVSFLLHNSITSIRKIKEQAQDYVNFVKNKSLVQTKTKKRSLKTGLNHRPFTYKANALPTKLLRLLIWSVIANAMLFDFNGMSDKDLLDTICSISSLKRVFRGILS